MILWEDKMPAKVVARPRPKLTTRLEVAILVTAHLATLAEVIWLSLLLQAARAHR